MQKILFVGGGSIGHVAPSVAVWRSFKKSNPDAEALFVCSNRADDREFLTKEHLNFLTIQAPRLSWSFIWRFPQAIVQSIKIINAFRPDLIFAKGGYVSVPLCYIAHRKKIPIVLHESDAVMGRANKLISKWATAVCTGFPLGDHFQYTGNPIRPEVTEGSRKKGLKISGLSGDKPILLVYGGSQGSQAINEAITNQLDALLKLVQIIHITGRGKLRYSIFDIRYSSGYFRTDFVVDELPHFYACSDIAISRAGASNIAELSANNISAALIPLRGVANDHQYINAQQSEENGDFVLLEQKNLEKQLQNTIQKLLENRGQQERETRPGNEAPGQISEIISKTLAKQQRGQ